MADAAPPPAAPASGGAAVAAVAATSDDAASAANVRRCFICFMDEGETGAPASAWVAPCPCTLEAHQDCMLDWVADLERQKKDLRCPVCRSPIHVDGPWDPVIALADLLRRGLSRVSPSLLAAGAGFGTAVGLGAYGLVALRVFAGGDAVVRYLYRWAPDGRLRLNATHVLMTPWIGPALVVAQTMPFFARPVYLPLAGLYGVFHLIQDENFLSWPPSPPLVVALLPSLEQAYHAAYHEMFCAWEARMDRQLLGLADPDLQHQAEEQRARGAGGGVGNENADADADQNAPAAPAAAELAPRPAFLGRIMNLIDNILALPNMQVNFAIQEGNDDDGQIQQEGAVGFDLQLDLVGDVEDGGEDEGLQAPPDFGDIIQDDFPAPANPQQGNAPANQPNNQNQNQNQNNGGGAQLQTALIDIANALAASLLLPGISYGVGELLCLSLPKRWTTPARIGMFRMQTGLLQERWGRSLVGGCVYLVLRDAFRLWTKHRRVVNRPLRRVRNVERRRG